MTTKSAHTTAACIVAVFLSGIAAFDPMRSVQAFQPASLFMQPSTTSMLRNTRTAFPSRSTPCTVMRYQSPWDLAANSGSRMQPSGGGSPKGWPGYTLGPMTFSLPGLLQDCPLQVEDPDVAETDTGYTLTFNLPEEVREDGLDISVSGRVLTVEVRVARKDKLGDAADASAGRGGWVSHSSRTHSAARSFVLPVGVAASDVTASWVSDGKVEVKLEKTPAGTADVGARSKVSIGVAEDMEDAAGVRVHGTKETVGSAVGADKISSSAMEYLSGLKSAPTEGGIEPGSFPASSPAESSSPGSSPPRVERDHRRNRSVLAALDDEFRDLAKAMWCDGSVRFPTEEQVAATVEAAREERARRVTAMKRATMATDVSEKDQSYAVK